MIGCPHCHHELSEAQILTLIGIYRQSKRKMRRGGRPRRMTEAEKEKTGVYGVCHDCGHPLDRHGFCTAPMSAAD